MAELPLEDESSCAACPDSLLLMLFSLMDGLGKHLPEPLECDGVYKNLEKLSESTQGPSQFPSCFLRL